MSSIKIHALLFLSLMTLGCQKNKQQETIDIDTALSTTKVDIFAEGIVSTNLYERDIAIAQNGTELIYSIGDYKQKKRCLVQIRKRNGKWSKPEIVNISGKYQDIEPFYAEEGKRLFFASNRPIEKGSKREDYNIWYSDRNGDLWGEPKALGKNINTVKDEFYPSISKNGNLYFTASKEDGIGREDIFVAKKVDGKYQNPSVLDSTINTMHYEFNAFISPDENVLIFSSFGREDGYGGGDLYFSIRDKEGKWQKAQNMGEHINSPQLDYCPFIDTQRNNLYFTSERIEKDSARIKSIEEMSAFSNKVKNGMGNIYRISLDKLNLE